VVLPKTLLRKSKIESVLPEFIARGHGSELIDQARTLSSGKAVPSGDHIMFEMNRRSAEKESINEHSLSLRPLFITIGIAIHCHPAALSRIT
jgi:hypothetical protein